MQATETEKRVLACFLKLLLIFLCILLFHSRESWKYICRVCCSLVFKAGKDGKSGTYAVWTRLIRKAALTQNFPICSAAIYILFFFSIGDFRLPGRALLSAPRGGHVGRPVAEKMQVSWDRHSHCLRTAWLLWTGERKHGQYKMYALLPIYWAPCSTNNYYFHKGFIQLHGHYGGFQLYQILLRDVIVCQMNVDKYCVEAVTLHC